MLETILSGAKRYAQKTAVALGAAASIASFQPQSANADVYFTVEPKNAVGVPQHIFDRSPCQIKLYIYADNTTEQDPTATVEFKVNAPKCITFEGPYRMDPYISHYNDLVEKPSPTRDFFYPLPLNSNANYVRLSGAKRSIAGPTTASFPSTLQGVSKKKGLVGMVSLYLNENTPPGDYQFEITGTARKSDGSLQPSKGAVSTIRVVPNYTISDQHPVVIQDMNYAPGTLRKVPHLRVSHINGKSPIQIQSSTDLKTWSTLGKSKIYTGNYSEEVDEDAWLPFTFVDTEANLLDKRFYRLYVAPQN